jgi:Zn-dependent peptidase ImmA (M78 family)/transcriptional regulator with XRE-family HTH domain
VPEINPQMIVVARESRGWTQQDLARGIGASQGTVSKYELALLGVAENHAEAIARLTRYDIAFFQQSEQIIALGGDFLYRKRASVPGRIRRRIQAEANVLKMQLARLMQGAELKLRYGFPAIQPEEMNGRVDKVAAEVRRAWRLPPGPIRNLTAHIEAAGAVVFAVDFETDLIDGTNIRLPGLPPMLFLNRNVSGERHRLNLAHECGHAVMHFTTSLNDAEDEAFQFAQELLMPRAEIRSDLRNLDLAAAARLKGIWGVSMAAIIMRAKTLGVITESTYRRLFTAMNANGLRAVEPLPLPFEQPETFEKLKRMHRDQLGLSVKELNRLLYTDSLGELPPPEEPQMRLVWPD